MRINHCKTCGQKFAATGRAVYCSPDCRSRKAPAVYRYICPDGRSYVGGVSDIRKRDAYGIYRSNLWLEAAFELYPPESWVFEIRCSERELRAAEQHHMDRLQSLDPEHGFNILRPGLRRNEHEKRVHTRERRLERARNRATATGTPVS